MGTSREQGNCRTSDNDDSNAHLAFPSYNQFGSTLYGLRRTIPYGLDPTAVLQACILCSFCVTKTVEQSH